jgi:hypothetical protein
MTTGSIIVKFEYEYSGLKGSGSYPETAFVGKNTVCEIKSGFSIKNFTAFFVVFPAILSQIYLTVSA